MKLMKSTLGLIVLGTAVMVFAGPTYAKGSIFLNIPGLSLGIVDSQHHRHSNNKRPQQNDHYQQRSHRNDTYRNYNNRNDKYRKYNYRNESHRSNGHHYDNHRHDRNRGYSQHRHGNQNAYRGRHH